MIEFDELLQRVDSHCFWSSYLADALSAQNAVGVHIAVFSDPFLELVLSGEKTIESRFGKIRCAPFGSIFEGDIVLIKEVSGPICGLTLAQRTWCYDLTDEPIEHIKDRFGTEIQGHDAFWLSCSGARYATLIELEKTIEIAPVRCEKRDRRGWVSLGSRQLSLDQ